MRNHDQLCKDLLRTFFAGFLRLVAPGPAGRLDLSRVAFLDKETFTDWPEGGRREVDLLAAAPLRQDPENLHLLHVEVEAEARAGMDRRLWDYDRQLRLRHGLPVLSILVNLRNGRPGLHTERVQEESLGIETGAFTYIAVGLEGARAEDFLTFPEPPAWALAALMRSEGLGRAAHKLACKRPIAAAVHLSELERFLLENFVETYVELTPEEAAEYEQLRASEENREVRAMELTWADKMEAKYQAMAEAKAEAIYQAKYEAKAKAERQRYEAEYRKKLALREKEIRSEGEAAAARRLLLRLLDLRFGPLPSEVRHQVEAIASLDRLHRLAEQILGARSLEEMELG